MYPRVPPCTPVYPCVPLSTPEYPCVPLCTPVYPCVPLCTPMYPRVPLCTLVYPRVPLRTPVYPSLCTFIIFSLIRTRSILIAQGAAPGVPCLCLHSVKDADPTHCGICRRRPFSFHIYSTIDCPLSSRSVHPPLLHPPALTSPWIASQHISIMYLLCAAPPHNRSSALQSHFFSPLYPPYNSYKIHKSNVAV